MKECLKCKIEKDETEFGKTFGNKLKTKFNLRSYCKKCDREINKEYCQKNKEILAEKRKKRVKTERERIGVSVKNGFSVVSKEEHKRKESCRHKAIALRKSGKIKVYDFCQICGTTEMSLEMHHANYDKPELVVFLCRPCHLKIHWNVLNER